MIASLESSMRGFGEGFSLRLFMLAAINQGPGYIERELIVYRDVLPQLTSVRTPKVFYAGLDTGQHATAASSRPVGERLQRYLLDYSSSYLRCTLLLEDLSTDGCGNSILSTFCTSKGSFYQDRLGTNIGK